MEAFAAPLRPLAERAAWWVRHREVRLLHVCSSSSLRGAATQLVLVQEYHAENRSPFVALDAPYLLADAGWTERTAQLREDYEARAKAMKTSGIVLPELGAAPQQPEAYATFGRQVLQYVESIGAPLSGLVVVIAPQGIQYTERLEQELGALLDANDLGKVRWVLIDQASSSIPKLIERLGGSASAITCVVDEKQARADFGVAIDAAINANPRAPGLAQTGAAWPKGIAPPARVELPAPPKVPATAAMASAAALSDAGFRSVRPLTLKAAKALRDGDPLAAVSAQRQVVEACRKAGRPRETIVMEMLLATYVVHANEATVAEGMYGAIADRAKRERYFDLAVQALMAAAALRLLDRDRDQAAVLYGQAGQIARDNGQPELAIEGYRMAGQLRAESGDQNQAARLFTEAVGIGNTMPPPAAGQTSAPTAARQLADLCVKLGMSQQAQALRDQAARMDEAGRGGTA